MSKEVLFLVTTIASFLLPICLAVIWKTKTKCNWMAFAIGALCFMLFANFLEAALHTYLLSINKTTSNFLYSNGIAYGLYGALVAGLFEETGRYIAFKFLLKNHNTKEVSVGYGIGHGGIECVITLGVTYLLYTIVLLGGSLGDATTDQLMLQTISQVDVTVLPLALIERISAMSLHIALSILVFKAAKVKNKFYLYPLSILIHMIADIPAGLYQAGLFTSLLAVEGIIILISATALVVGIVVYKKMDKEIA